MPQLKRNLINQPTTGLCINNFIGNNGIFYYRIYFQNGLCHRKNGPAIIEKNKQSWYLNGLKHREDGPAIYFKYENVGFWYYHGERIYCESLKEFQRLIKLIVLF